MEFIFSFLIVIENFNCAFFKLYYHVRVGRFWISTLTFSGGIEVNSPLDCNVLVANKVHTTYKFLSVIALGIPIISENWLREMKETGKLMPYDKFALLDSRAEKRYKFVLSDTLASARKNPLYHKYSILVTANTRPGPEELSSKWKHSNLAYLHTLIAIFVLHHIVIIQCAGGHLLSEEPRPGDKLLAISTIEDSRSWPSIKNLFPGITIIDTNDFLTSIISQKLNFSKSVLAWCWWVF